MTVRHHPFCPARRRLLGVPLLLTGLAATPGVAWGSAIRELRGPVLIDGRPADPDTPVQGNEIISTGRDGGLVLVMGDNAFRVRPRTAFRLVSDDGALVSSLRLLTGALLSVFGPGRRRLVTSVATIGIRGTAVYLEMGAEEGYVCTCYGQTELATLEADPSREDVDAGYHAARWVRRGPEGIRTAPFLNHTDEELVELEALVGRTPAFVRPASP